MKTMKFHAAAAILVGLSGAACADPIFDNLTSVAGGFQPITPFDPTVAIVDDLIVEGGGELQDLTFTYTYSGAGFGIPSESSLDLGIGLALDNGDGVFSPRDDALLHSENVTGLIAELSVVKTHTLSLPSGINVGDGATIWFTTTYAPGITNFVNWGQATYNDLTVGSSDSSIYTFDFASNFLSPVPVFDGSAVGAVLTVTPAPATVLALAPLGLALRRRR